MINHSIFNVEIICTGIQTYCEVKLSVADPERCDLNPDSVFYLDSDTDPNQKYKKFNLNSKVFHLSTLICRIWYLSVYACKLLNWGYAIVIFIVKNYFVSSDPPPDPRKKDRIRIWGAAKSYLRILGSGSATVVTRTGTVHFIIFWYYKCTGIFFFYM